MAESQYAYSHVNTLCGSSLGSIFMPGTAFAFYGFELQFQPILFSCRACCAFESLLFDFQHDAYSIFIGSRRAFYRFFGLSWEFILVIVEFHSHDYLFTYMFFFPGIVLWRNYYIKNVVLFEEKSILVFPERLEASGW